MRRKRLLARSCAVGEVGPQAAEILADLHRTAFDRRWSKQEFADLLRRPTSLALLARQRSWRGVWRPVGFILLQRVEEEAEILSIAVSSQLRRRGIGRALLDEAIRRLYAEGRQTLFLEVDRNNQPAVELYLSSKFKVAAERTGYYASDDGPATTALVMRRNLR